MSNTWLKNRSLQLMVATGLVWSLGPLGSVGAQPANTQALYANPAEAVTALGQAVRSKDTNALRRVFGAAIGEITNPDPVQREDNLVAFAQHLAESTTLSNRNADTIVLLVGKESWPFPIPLVKTNGTWLFDTRAGKEEILNRRIGQNELMAIDVCLAYVKAQREYALKDWGGSGVMEYAQKIRSSPGKRDGLYWVAPPNEEQSPFGPLVAQAHAEGYGKEENSTNPQNPPRRPFHGYYFKILTKEGKHVPGGKYDYIINGHMVAGFAFLAYPATWGNSGVMSFMVNQQGKVYQKNLGEKTSGLAEKIREYDPDDTWQPVK